MQAKAERCQQPAAKQMALTSKMSSTLLVSFTICSSAASRQGHRWSAPEAQVRHKRSASGQPVGCRIKARERAGDWRWREGWV